MALKNEKEKNKNKNKRKRKKEEAYGQSDRRSKWSTSKTRTKNRARKRLSIQKILSLQKIVLEEAHHNRCARVILLRPDHVPRHLGRRHRLRSKKEKKIFIKMKTSDTVNMFSLVCLCVNVLMCAHVIYHGRPPAVVLPAAGIDQHHLVRASVRTRRISGVRKGQRISVKKLPSQAFSSFFLFFFLHYRMGTERSSSPERPRATRRWRLRLRGVVSSGATGENVFSGELPSTSDRRLLRPESPSFAKQNKKK